MSILKLKPVCKDYLWGGRKLKTDFFKESKSEKVAESWELSCHKSGLSQIVQGDGFFIESGTIHAIGKGILIAEIQQNSNITYRVYDYNRKDANGNTRELHIDKAIQN